MSKQGNIGTWAKLFSSGLCLQDQNIPVTGLVLQEKASDLAKNLAYMILKHQMNGLTDGRHRIMSHLRQCQVKQNHAR